MGNRITRIFRDSSKNSTHGDCMHGECLIELHVTHLRVPGSGGTKGREEGGVHGVLLENALLIIKFQNVQDLIPCSVDFENEKNIRAGSFFIVVLNKFVVLIYNIMDCIFLLAEHCKRRTR